MEFLEFIADWTLNIVGGMIIGAFALATLLVVVIFIAGFFTSKTKPKEGLIGTIDDAMSGGLNGCLLMVVFWVVATLVCGLGMWMINLL